MSLRKAIQTTWGSLRYLWNVAGIALLMFVVAEGSCRVAGHLKRRVAAPAGPQLPAEQILGDTSWGPQYLRDVATYQWKNRFETFVGFRALPLSSESVNISEGGIRTTPHNDAPHERNTTLYLFGGSTMIGVGVPDWGTIPAYLSLRHKEDGVPHEVVNQAACWWTSSQSLAHLIVLLRHGHRPDIVVFYDGINDINVVTFGGRVGGISPEAEDILQRGFQDEPSLARGILSHSLLLRMVLNRIRPDGLSKGMRQFEIADEELERSAREIVQAYENNARMVVALGREFQFKPFLFFQPSPFIARKPMAETDNLATADRRRGRPDEHALYTRVYELVRASEILRSCSAFHDLQDIFAAEERPMYCDCEHLLPEGNELVARAMYDRIRSALSNAPGSPQATDMSE